MKNYYLMAMVIISLGLFAVLFLGAAMAVAGGGRGLDPVMALSACVPCLMAGLWASVMVGDE